MLFITNRAFNEGIKSNAGRKLSFNLADNQAAQSAYFCERTAPGEYTEIMSGGFLSRLKESNAEQILLYIHGFSNLPEDHIFPRAEELQRLFDEKQKGLIQVVSLIWPCDNDAGLIQDYWDDQIAADASGVAFSRVLEFFMKWRDLNEPCMKRINVLAHSMGNRVLRETLDNWSRYHVGNNIPMLFRNVFMVAADVVNETLQYDERGHRISIASRNVSVFFAADDLALRSSKIANLKNKVASRRMGHTGPENLDKVPKNIFSFDCDEFNLKYDPPVGHSYFLTDKTKKPGKVFNEISKAVINGRVEGVRSSQQVKIL